MTGVPPDLAMQIENVQYFKFGIFGAWLCDVFGSLPEEIYIVRRYGIKIPDTIYVLARLSAGWFLILNTIFGVAPLKHCFAVFRAEAWASSVVLVVHCLLFLFRVRAVFFDQNLVTAFFSVAWLFVLATSLLSPFSLRSGLSGPTGSCLDTTLKPFGIVGGVVAATYDTLVFIAISTKLVLFNQNGTTSWAKMFFTGKGMGSTSRILLQSGQLYYLVTVGFIIASAVAIVDPSLLGAYSDLMVPLAAFMAHAMVTRVYRQLKLGLIRDESPSVVAENLTSLEFRSETVAINATSEISRSEATLS